MAPDGQTDCHCGSIKTNLTIAIDIVRRTINGLVADFSTSEMTAVIRQAVRSIDSGSLSLHRLFHA